SLISLRMAGEIVEPWDDNINKTYKQENIIGKGAYGVVYTVTHIHTGQIFAMKKMEMRVSEEGVPQSVIREISSLAVLGKKKHENINTMHESLCGVSNNGTTLSIYLVMEKCDWDLYAFLRDIPRDMPDMQCRVIAMQIFRGVDFLHANNIVHRDLKPQNVLINKDQTVKIADFGLSRTYSSQSCFTTTVVTLWYRSPELLLQTSYNSAVDIWAIGCILSEIYNRRPLFSGQTEAQQLLATFTKMGLPSPAEWPRGAVIERSTYHELPRLPDPLIFGRMPQEGADLAKSCLDYQPERRCSARTALSNRFFHGVSHGPSPTPLREIN
ncbi:hypothetical protein PENTCL1PPCAC_27800, partial [Pristionchus entomophagus]